MNHTQKVISAVKETSSGLYEITFLTNSFLFLKDTSYINKSLAALSDFSRITDNLDTLVSDNVVQKRRIRILHNSQKIFRDQAMMLLHTDAVSSNPNLFHNTYQRLGVEATYIHKLLSDMTDTENMLLQNRIQSKENYSKKILQYNWLIMLVAVTFLSSAFVLLDRELSRNKLYRIELENKIEALNRSNSELEQFAYVASHDMQEPLRKIRSFADRIRIKFGHELPADVTIMLSKIDNSSRRLQSLINDLLSFSRTVNAGSVPVLVNLSVPLTEAQANLSEMIADNGAEIYYDALPSLAIYQTQVTQLFQNLLSNSIKYSKPGEKPVVRIQHQVVTAEVIPAIKAIHQDSRFHEIRVTDNGIGFREEFSNKIFVIFQRLHDRDHFEGTGIGLAICKRVVSNHNGYIFAESVEGEGSCFIIYFPIETSLS
ncbi:MAG TPA: ATP-binding protein [Dyadobacter sp.]|nr:ATP-binding protein [Dyadobacter sp.]